MTMEQTINKQLLEFAVGQRITCDHCDTRHVLDARDAVLVTLKTPQGDREYIMCGQIWDTRRYALADLAHKGSWEIEAIDGRDLYPQPKAARRMPIAKPQTPAERRERMVAALTALDRRNAARAARNPRAHYSPYALGLYLEAVDRVERMIAEGDLVPVACNHVFSGPVLKAVLKAIGEVA